MNLKQYNPFGSFRKHQEDVVKEILEMDPELESEAHSALKRKMQQFIDEQMKNMTL